jgi:hypothetical protein
MRPEPLAGLPQLGRPQAAELVVRLDGGGQVRGP